VAGWLAVRASAIACWGQGSTGPRPAGSRWRHELRRACHAINAKRASVSNPAFTSGALGAQHAQAGEGMDHSRLPASLFVVGGELDVDRNLGRFLRYEVDIVACGLRQRASSIASNLRESNGCRS